MLIRRIDPDPRTAGLVALLDGLNWDRRMIDPDGTRTGQLASRVREVKDGAGWAANEAASEIGSRIWAAKHSWLPITTEHPFSESDLPTC